MSENLKIDYVEFPASDFDAVQNFYQQTFGWNFTEYGPDYRAFSDGKIDGGFYRSGGKSTTANGAALVIFYALDIDEAKEKVQANGGTIVKDIFAFPGGRRFQFTDPHGNELAIWSDR